MEHNIQFEITVTTTESTEGKLDIKLFSAGANTKGEAVQKMNFSINHKVRAGEAEANQYEALSKGMIAILKPLQDIGNQNSPNTIPLPDSEVKSK
ncbi:hypothetical protein [Ferruginibacter sp. HRS2-29]|uniref:hypothetical protein n=1 Tax=Ferruginibacter sp. HRS2-29 TaxID=2487334 RepID=UPI0020CE65BC|nr:hypothetical protein [Ferruginibacter sp. HRS2-29]MCP9752351.1 hypothetical protein [Ferruginibacter sp. HRS2-29]